MIAFYDMKSEQIAFGIDIGGTNTKIGLFDTQGKLLEYKIHPTSKDLAPEKFVEQLAQECEAILQEKFKTNLGNDFVLGVGVGAPMANYYTGQIDHAPNLGWKNVPLKKFFQDKFKTNASIENDANLAAYGEKRWGAGMKFKDFILVTLGTGVGTGLILGHKLYRGHNALGAEGGHIIIPHSKQRLCSCGGLNHLESFLSAKGIKQTIFELIGEHWTIEKLGIELKAKNLKAETIIQTIAEELATALASMAVLLGPEAFLIGGGVSKLGNLFNQIIQKKLDELLHFTLKGKVQILSANLSTDRGAIHGGAALIFDEVNS